jgi:hypothetical protein
VKINAFNLTMPQNVSRNSLNAHSCPSPVVTWA